MARQKKVLSLVLAVVMVISMFAINAIAASPEATFALSAPSTANAGDTITVTVALTTDYYVGPTSVPVAFDADAFDYVANSAQITNVYGSATNTDKAATLISDGNLLVVISPKSGASGVAPMYTTSTTLFTFQLKVSDSATAGNKTINIVDDKKTDTNSSGTLFCGSLSSSDLDTATVATTGQTININPTSATVTVATAVVADPELILTQTGAENGAIIDNEICTSNYDGAVYGIDTINGEDIADYVTTEVGSVEIVENDNGNFSTGALIYLKNTAGEVVETYVFIYFGDINGDGAVDISDAGDVEAHDQWVATLDDDSAAFYSADVNYDGAVDISDAGDIEAHDQWVSQLDDQSIIAAEIVNVW